MSELVTNFNVAPYFDDYDRSKRFYRILIIPARAVQSRELIQMQTILQDQIKRHADHVFKDGSIVQGCNLTYIPNMSYVRLNNAYNVANSNSAFDETLQDYLVVSANTGARASIRLTKPGYLLQYPNTNTLYVDYIKSGRDGSNNEVVTFQSGETLNIYLDSQDKFANTLDSGKLYNTINVMTANVAANQSSTGDTFAVTVGEGIVYQKGFFVNVIAHTITVRDYSVDVDDYLVGFNTEEQIVTHLQDSSLIDPADTSSRNGIGAHRLKLEPILVSRKRSDITEDDNFFPIVEFSGGKPAIAKTAPEYAALGDVMARDKYEESGDFYVKPLLVSTESTSNTATFNYAISPGIGWVKGNRVELLSTKRVETDRATTTADSQAAITTLNYGYYALVDELVGTFDFDQLNSIDIYDTAQNSISDIEGTGSAPSGNKIGTANIRMLTYNTGAKGTSSATYRAFLTNITMNSGASFSTQAKSLFSNTGSHGTAKADFVLTDGKAVINDSSRNSLVFPTGTTGLKRLRDSTGVNDTQFYVRDISSATLQSNGFVTFTLNSPHAGGTERFFASAGALSSGNEDRIDIATSNASWTANLTGTVNSTTGGANSTTLTGSGTSFTTVLKTGDIVRVSGNSTAHYLRTVTNVGNNTVIELSSAIAHTNTGAVVAKYFPAGHVFDLANGAVVTALSNTQFSVQLTGVTFANGAPQTVNASYPVLRTGAVEAKKTANKNRYVKINCNTGGTTGPWNLGLTDVYKVHAVYVGTSYSTSNPDRTAWFNLDNGQSGALYDHAKLVLKPQFVGQLTSSSRIIVELSHFESSFSAGIGFYSVDSYPVRNPGVSANSTNISYAEIPIFNGVELRSCIDFRPSKINSANSATIVDNATENPAVSNSSFNVSGSGTYLADPDSNFQADVEFFLPRIDLVQVNRDGAFNVKSSIPAINPKAPAADIEAMSLAEVAVPPFPSLAVDEQQEYGMNRARMQVTLRQNRRYTMRDIGVLDQRISRIEYYQQLSQLEAQAKDYTVKDADGLDRFKNGLFADPFNNHLLGAYSNFEYSIAIDQDESIARPKYRSHAIDLALDQLDNTYAAGSVLSLPFESLLFISQPYASKFRNVTESVWNWSGSATLYPGYDHHVDEINTPSQNVVIDLATPWEEFASSPFGTSFGDWRTVAKTSKASTAASTIGNQTTTTTTTTTSETLKRQISQLKVGTSLTSYDLGTYVTDIQVSPFMRSREIAFVATALKPNTKFYVYFDRIAVSQHCAPAAINPLYYDPNIGVGQAPGVDKESNVVTRSANWGTQLVSDNAGNLVGLFRLPAATFRVGDRELLIANVDDLTTGSDAITSATRATYTASSINQVTSSTTLHTINPVLSTRTTQQTSVQKSTNITARTTVTPPAIPVTTPLDQPEGNPDASAGDPIGQSFLVEVPQGIPGMFVDKIGVFFKSKDPTLGVRCFITEMLAGQPDTSRTISSSYLKPSQISTSNDASAETEFVFTDIPYLSAGAYYTFFIQPDGNSPEYQIFMAEIGGTDISSGMKIFSNPNIGVAWLSANSNSWNALQKEDIKFNIYRCQFQNSTGTATFIDQNDEYITVNGFTAVNTSTTVQVGDLVYTQNASASPAIIMAGNTDPFGVVQLVDYATDTLVLDSSRGGFTGNTWIEIHRPSDPSNTALLNANTLISTAVIESVDDKQYSIVVPRLAAVTPFGTTVDMEFKGMANNETVDSAWIGLEPEIELELLDQMRVIKSTSNRDAVDSSAQFRVTLATASDYLSPIVDLRRRSALFIENLINNDITNEHTRYGSALVKYLSQTIVLAEGQDAEDIRVVITGYRPSGTEIHAYIKLLNSEDTDVFESKLWTKLDMTAGSAIYSNILDSEDYREYEFSLPTAEAQQGEAYCNPSNDGIVQYRNTAGSVYVGYKSFAIKLVLISDRAERVPRMRDVRAIALQV